MNNLFKINLKKSGALARINLKSLKLIPIIMAIIAVVMDTQVIIQMLTINSSTNQTIAGFDFLILGCVLTSIFLATSNFYKSMRLNAKKKDFFWGALLFMAITAAAVAFISMFSFYALYNPVEKGIDNLSFMPLFRVFKFSSHGFFIGFIQMFGFVFFISVFIFILSSVQDCWVGWTANVLIVACISIFSSSKTLRKYTWKPFFNALIFGHPALQILFTVLGGLALYFVYLPILKRKKI